MAFPRNNLVENNAIYGARFKESNVQGGYINDDNKLMTDECFILLDLIGEYWGEYFKDDMVTLPIDWQPYEIENGTYFLKGQIMNKNLENMADEWLETKS